ncbi:hypothetical protein [Nocardioides lianchengensis]|uniref:Uncharacterized protein n=1 Tax=Nocardioides lianchengensis TaxID=1045774 RepID=A0A1G6IGZ1_9ACTN|nr:hypothetical protein [Nocardioides lianchengensis]NYG13066.1 hypothetical protein [Nocardioides lianchengensis]SDC05016.1 hypothetical protein SAMN05421872_101160 [Nocardioides lianchengensis]
MPDTSERRAPQTTVSWVAVSDVVIGLVVLIAGLAQDSTPLAIGGGVLLMVGVGVLSTASMLRNRPSQP